MWDNLHQTRYIDMVPAYQTWVLLASLFVFTSSFYFNHEAWSWQLLFRKSKQKQYKYGVKMCIDPCTMYIAREMFLDCGKLVVARFPDSLLCMGWALCWPALGCKPIWEVFIVHKCFQQGIWCNGKHLMFKTSGWWKTSCTTWDA